MVIGRVIVGKIVGKIGRVSDGDDGSVGNGVISEVAHVGFGSVCSLCMVSVVLYKRDGIGSDKFDPSEIERVFQIPSLRSGMMGVSVVGCWIYGATCDAACAIMASEMVWVEWNGLVLQMPGTNFEKLPHSGLQNDIPRM